MTDLTSLQQELMGKYPHFVFKFEEPMALHTSLRIGGPAEVMAFPQTHEQLSQLLRFCAEASLQPVILGAGTNVLAPDEGLRGIVICLKDALSGMELLDECRLRVAAGVTMTRAAVFAANHGLSGLEFSHGIPGSVGGGVYMNAGAYGGEISSVCTGVQIMRMDGTVEYLSNAQMEFSYRHSVLEAQKAIVLSADFSLTPKESDEIWAVMKQLQAKRSASQPLDLPSAGSAFKRPVGGYAAALIDQAGLKGYQVGGAAISTKHAGFAVNLGGATAADMRALLQQVSDKVFENSGIRLEPEVRIW